LIAKGDVSTQTKRGKEGAIHYAAYYGFVEIIKQLIDFGVDINMRE